MAPQKRIPPRDAPDHVWTAGLDLNLPDVASAHNVQITGIVQVGAHLGQELSEFRRFGDIPILLIEPNPPVYQQLLLHIKDMPNVLAINVAVAHERGELDFYIPTASSQTASFLVPNSSVMGSSTVVKVTCLTLDEIMSEHGNPAMNALVVDVQGFERQVLAGSTKALPSFDVVMLEMTYGLQLYENISNGYEIEELMASAGFRMAAMDPFECHPRPAYPLNLPPPPPNPTMLSTAARRWCPCWKLPGDQHGTDGYADAHKRMQDLMGFLLLHYPRLFLHVVKQLSSNFDHPFKVFLYIIPLIPLAHCFASNKARVRAELSRYLQDLSKRKIKHSQMHTNALFIRPK